MMKISTICNETKVLVVIRTMYRPFVLIALLLVGYHALQAQECTTLGQTPATAFPVCGESVFKQTNVPICGIHNLNVPGCSGDGAGYADKNPFWYRFTCFTAGTLAFTIKPNDMGDDYDWMLYDITNHNAADVFTDKTLIVTGNWAGTYGLTGASASGVNFIQCASDPSQNKNAFAKMPSLVEGHTYLLMVSHYTDGSQSGYQLSFGGGTAVITDPKEPEVNSAYASCGGRNITVIMNKKMKCSSLATDGSDFILSPANATIVSVKGNGCTSGFDMDTVVLTLSNDLPPGTYTVTMKKGGDGNTLLDNCDRNIPEGDKLSFTLYPIFPTPLDSIAPVKCSPDKLQLVFRKPIDCSSVAADGSDFTISGPQALTIINAAGICNNGVSTSIYLQLASPIVTAGTYTISLRNGTDGDPIVDECGQTTPAGSTVSFIAADTVNADFTWNLLYGCKEDTVNCFHPGGNSINSWSWNFNKEGSSSTQNASYKFKTFTEKTVSLVVSNGVCKDSTAQVINLDNALDAAFGAPDILCPEEPAVFTDSSTGKINYWHWDFGNSTTSEEQNPTPFKFARPPVRSLTYTVQLIIGNEHNCFDTASRKMEIVNTCIIAVPNAFTPNGDGNNDLLYPLNAFKATKLEFKVYNRYGQLVFETSDWTKRWDGTINGKPQTTGLYVWTLRYVHKDTGKEFSDKGVVTLIR